jgi:RND family efflux transporter MFP subunit
MTVVIRFVRLLFPFESEKVSRNGLGLVALVVLLGFGASACTGGEADAAKAGGPGGGRGGAAMAVPVEMVTLSAKPVEQKTEFVATVRSRRSSNVQPQVEGFLTAIRVKSGDSVAPGKVLFEIDSTTQQAAVAALQSQRAAREADAVFAKQQAERAKLLLDAGATSQQEYEQAISQQKAADAQLKAVEEQIKQQQAELAYYKVTAATGGVIGDVPVRVGDRVTRTTMLTTIDDNAGQELYIGVPVQQAPNLRVGLPGHLIGENGETIGNETINFVSATVDDTTQTVLAKTPLTPRAGNTRFRADQFVRAQVVWNTQPAITAPVVSVVRVAGQYFAYVAEPANGGFVAKQRSVTLGPIIGQEYIVLSGLKEGDRLITSGIQKIGDGVPVQQLPAGPPGGGAPGAEPQGGRAGGSGS